MIKLFIFLLFLYPLALQAATEGIFYIYQDNNGHTFIEDSISANHAKYGYRVVSSQGITIKKVPSVHEQKRRNEKRRKRINEQTAARTQRAADEVLLHSFVDENDIRETGNKKIMAIQNEIEITNNHIFAFENNLRQLEAQIHKADLAGHDVTQNQIEDIRRIKNNIEQNKSFITRKIKQQEKIREQYIEFMQRFSKLTSH